LKNLLTQRTIIGGFMSKVENGNRVKVHYRAKLEDGQVFETSENRTPLDFMVGEGEVMPGIEQGVVGMSVGETKTIKMPPEEAFGQRRKELVVEVNKSEFPNHITPEIGQRLQVRQPNGQEILVTVTGLGEENITLDANHPLAGYTLVFDIELVEIT
jgi:FKBP-type peptidyl-prolyl cis-trans isomerase 2